MNQELPLFPEPKWVDQLKPGEKIDWYYRILELSKKKKKDGNDFLTLTLMDKTGRIAGKIWENAAHVEKTIQTGTIYRISGEVTEYNQKCELRINRILPLTGKESGFSEEDFTESAPFDVTEMLTLARQITYDRIQTPFLRELLDRYFTRFSTPLLTHYGAMRIHHAYPGGLLEHTTTLLKLAVSIADHYALNTELLLIGVLFHDIGKLYEFQIQPALDITLPGGLLGHVMISYSLFLELIRDIPQFPEEWAMRIQHLIISHHGEKEFGSPEVPKMPEAYALHIIDLLDSRMNIFSEVRDGAAGSKALFSDYQSALGTRILLNQE